MAQVGWPINRKTGQRRPSRRCYCPATATPMRVTTSTVDADSPITTANLVDDAPTSFAMSVLINFM
jgi:hypothetical protein